jgi:hypothetical protein
MKSFRSYLIKLDRYKQSPGTLVIGQPTELGREIENNSTQKKYHILLATTLIASSQFLAVMSASSNPVPTPSTPSPVVATRTILNGSFEQPQQGSNGAGFGIYESYRATPPIVWQTTEPGNSSGTYKDQLELWKGPHSQSSGPALGNQYAELNASTNAAIYQDVCVLANETVKWSLQHSARINGQINKMQVSITVPSAWSNAKTPPAVKLYSSGHLTSKKKEDGWKEQSGNWDTALNTSIRPLRFAFEAIEGSFTSSGATARDISYGNFIDDVKLNLSPLIDFLPTTGGNVNLASTTEGNTTNYYYLSLRINGIMNGDGSAKITLTGLNAGRQFTLGSVLKGSSTATGLSATKSGNQITLSIPAGTYDPNSPSNYIHIPIDFSDRIATPDDNLTFTLSNPTGGGTTGPFPLANLAIGSTNCSSAARSTVNTLLRDDDFSKRVQLLLPLTVAAHRSK